MQDFEYAPPVKEVDIVDNLTTDDATKVLSAKQGKVLNDNLGSPSSASGVTGADAFSKINTINSKIVITLQDSAVDLNTLVTDNYGYTKKWCGNTCANLTNAPMNTAIPWVLEAGTVGNNINYQWQEFRLYQSANAAGSKIYRRQKYYYGANDFRWNDWVSIDDKAAQNLPVSGAFTTDKENQYITPGVTAVYVNRTINSTGLNQWMTLIVAGSTGSHLEQTLLATGKLFTRHYEQGTWSSWTGGAI